jgi:hypothetical protein
MLLIGHSAAAVEYKLQIAHVEEKVFLRYVQTQGAPFRAERHILPQLQTLLDNQEIATNALLPERPVQLLDAYPEAAGAPRTATVKMLSQPPEPPWTQVVWESPAGSTAVFQIRSNTVHYQELTAIAVNVNGTLQRLPLSGVPLFGRQKLPAPVSSDTYLDYVRERGTFAAWVMRHAEERNGLSVVVGRNHNLFFPDIVYLVVHMPADARTYQVVLAWKDREELRKGNGGSGARSD